MFDLKCKKFNAKTQRCQGWLRLVGTLAPPFQTSPGLCVLGDSVAALRRPAPKSPQFSPFVTAVVCTLFRSMCTYFIPLPPPRFFLGGGRAGGWEKMAPARAGSKPFKDVQRHSKRFKAVQRSFGKKCFCRTVGRDTPPQPVLCSLCFLLFGDLRLSASISGQKIRVCSYLSVVQIIWGFRLPLCRLGASATLWQNPRKSRLTDRNHLSRLGSGKKNLAKPKVAQQPSERARASPTVTDRIIYENLHYETSEEPTLRKM